VALHPCCATLKSKQSFFEKKDQKTFVSLAVPIKRLSGIAARPQHSYGIKVFCFFFFKKEALSFSFLQITPFARSTSSCAFTAATPPLV
jgi:hypothetical protein